MNKQEAIDELENAIPDFILNDFQSGKETGLTYALELVEELDEPEKPVVPQFIDTWIQGAKYNGYDLYEAMNNCDVPNKTDYWIQDNPETFAKAWLYGYEVKKEKLYTVELPNHNSDGSMHIILIKTEKGICIDCYSSISYRNLSIAQLTETEIKKDFEWAWQFAKEVKEND